MWTTPLFYPPLRYVALLDVDPSLPRMLRYQVSMSMDLQIYIAGSLPAALKVGPYFRRTAANGGPNNTRPVAQSLSSFGDHVVGGYGLPTDDAHG